MTLTPAEWRRHIAQLDARDPDRPTLAPLANSANVATDPPDATPDTATPDHPTDAAGRALRHDGWTPDRQRTFLDAVAEGLSTEQACRLAGMSPSSAYAFKKRAAGQAFALGWRAAQLIGRDRIADTLMARAIDGYTETVTRPNGDVVERHRFDNRMAMAMLARLDRQAEAADAGSIAANAAARLVAGEFDAYCALLDTPAPEAQAGLFLARRLSVGEEAATEPADPAAATLAASVHTLARADRFARTGAATPADVDTADLDPAQLAGWSAEQWARAHAAGLVQVAEDSPLSPLVADEDEDEAVDECPVWWAGDLQEWRTSFPPPPGFNGIENGEHGDRDYSRALTHAEIAAAEGESRAEATLARLRAAERRDAWFGQANAAIDSLHVRIAALAGAAADRDRAGEPPCRGALLPFDACGARGPAFPSGEDDVRAFFDDATGVERTADPLVLAPVQPDYGIARHLQPLDGPGSESSHARQ